MPVATYVNAGTSRDEVGEVVGVEHFSNWVSSITEDRQSSRASHGWA